ncbi:MAG: VWA domain-containing protein [Gammaproteobacteria bacterium]
MRTPASADSAPDRPWHRLEALPRELWRWSVVCSAGRSGPRLSGLIAWCEALQAGQLPAQAFDLGDPTAISVFRPVLSELGLPALVQGHPALVHQLMQSLLWHLDSLIDRPGEQSRAQALVASADSFRDNWMLQRQGWEDALALLQSLGDGARLHWDELQGRLNSREWSEARRIGGLLEQMPALTNFIDAVGRRQSRVHAPPAQQPQAHPDDAPQAHPRSCEDDDRQPEPASVDGVRTSRVIERMTGAESLALTHPVLRRLWRARFAEARLLTYDDRSPVPRQRPRPSAVGTAARQSTEASGHGPMLVCLDTSGSMRGAPENVAKACVLQALRSAHAGQRGCRLLAFGGPGELLERELGSDSAGLDALLDVMGQSFDGGTDVQTPIERAITTLSEAGWHDADLLVISDGEFGLTPATLEQLRRAKADLGLRVHGILIGDRETIGLVEICDTLHWVRDWRRYGATGARPPDGFSPVHSRSLTAMYFPNAIRR